MRATLIGAAPCAFVLACGSSQTGSSHGHLPPPPSDVAEQATTAPVSSAQASAAPASSAGPAMPASNDPHAPRLGWPLPKDCEPERCKTDSHELGLTCEEGGTCLNPCPVGLLPNKEGTFCEHACKVDRDCPGGSCTEEGICDAFPEFECTHLRDCPLADGHTGAQCKKSDPCINPCKPGLFQAKSGDCAKPCTTNADCPGGHCDDGFCGPTNAQPYPWE